MEGLEPHAGWTFGTLKDYLEHQIAEGDAHLEAIANERNHRYDERAKQAEEALKVGLAAAKEALSVAFASANQANSDAKESHRETHSAAALALELATREMKEKLLEMNNLRDQITGERSTYVTRDVLDAKLTAVSAETTTRLKTLEDAKGHAEGREGGLGATWNLLLQVVTVVALIIVAYHDFLK